MAESGRYGEPPRTWLDRGTVRRQQLPRPAFPHAAFCRWRIAFELCSNTRMRASVVRRCQVDSLPSQTVADPEKPAEVTPRLWPQLPFVLLNQLAQQLAQLLQRLRSESRPFKETNDAQRGIDS
jgi:hypothetical protein